MRTGIAVITYNREDFFQKLMTSLPDVDRLIVVNDGEPYNDTVYQGNIHEVIQHKKNRGVAASKKEAMLLLMKMECENFFICEDDIAVRDRSIVDRYIALSEETGIQHFNFGYHGPRNKTLQGDAEPRKVVRLKSGSKLALNKHLVGAFSFYTAAAINAAGVIDERFRYAYDHVEHTHRIIKAGMHPPFWWFADLDGSENMIEDLDPDLTNTTLEKNSLGWKLKLRRNTKLYKKMHSTAPADIPDTPFDEVRMNLETIKKSYAESSFQEGA